MKTHIEVTSRAGGKLLLPINLIGVSSKISEDAFTVILFGDEGDIPVIESYDEVKKMIEEASE